jgi:dipeptidase
MMLRTLWTAWVMVGMSMLLTPDPARACTNLLVTSGASADGSTFITYTCDGEFHPHLRHHPAMDHAPGEMLPITDWSGTVRGEIPQVSHIYAVVGLMNEHQLALAETTFDGRRELQNPDGLLHYWDLMQITLQRARTAREAIDVMTALVDAHGYRSTGESFSIADPDEAWILEMIGPGPGGQGAHWVALRVPDGYISGHANKARIGEFPLDDPDNCRYSRHVIDFAVEQGFVSPDEPFRFNEAYNPSTPKNQRYGSMRVWSLFRRAAPSLDLSPDYHRGVEGAEPYPMWVKPDEKLSVGDVFALMRDHYEDTPYDMTKGVDAGPFGNPVRIRPMNWAVDGVEYTWERPISTQQTGFSHVAQMRRWLPDAIGGVYWYGVDDTAMTCYFPLYCCITDVPPSFAVGSLGRFSWDSAWWVFNFVANLAYSRYADMYPIIVDERQRIEGHFIALQDAVEQTALTLHESDPDLMRTYLTDYCVMHGEQVTRDWTALGERLITIFNDGYMKDAHGQPRGTGYPEPWLRRVLDQRPDQFTLPEKDAATPE